MKTKKKVLVAECPECGTAIRFHKTLQRGQIVHCPECVESLQVYSTNPLELDWAFEEEVGDYDYDEYSNYEEDWD